MGRDKASRVFNFHAATVANLAELIAAAGLDGIDQLNPDHINRRVEGTDVKTYAQLYPCIEPGSLLNDDTVPADWKEDRKMAGAGHW